MKKKIINILYALGILNISEWNYISMNDKPTKAIESMWLNAHNVSKERGFDFKEYIKELIYKLDILDVRSLITYDGDYIALTDFIRINNRDTIIYFQQKANREFAFRIDGIFNYAMELMKNRLNEEFNDSLLLEEFVKSLPKEVITAVNRSKMLNGISI